MTPELEKKIETAEKFEDIIGLDEGIRVAVEILMKNGVKTFASCQGGRRHPYHWPTVNFYGSQEEALRARNIARENNLKPFELKLVWADDDRSDPWCWEMNFQPSEDFLTDYSKEWLSLTAQQEIRSLRQTIEALESNAKLFDEVAKEREKNAE